MKVAEQAPREGVIWSGATTARLRPWPHDPRTAHLVLSGSYDRVDIPSASLVSEWTATAGQWGYERVRTSALPTTTGDLFHDAGFTPVQHLTLLSVAHTERPAFGLPRDVVPRSVARWTVLRSSRLMRTILDIDHESFDAPWNLDHNTFSDAMNATASSRLFVSRHRGRIDGFVLVGTTDSTGYIQRLAVRPSARRTGVGLRLVARAIEWSFKKGCGTTVVNTETTNTAALRLYTALGFVAHADGLVVMECAT